MISQFFFLLSVYVIGLLLTRWILGAQVPALVVTLAFPLGLATWVALAWAILYVGFPYTAAIMQWVTGMLVLVLAALNIRRAPLQRLELGWIALGSLGFIALAWVADRVDCVLLSYDSFNFIQLGRAFAFDGGVTVESWETLASWGVFQSIVQSVSVFVGLDYIYAVQPLIGVSLCGALFALSYCGLRQLGVSGARRTGYPALAALFVASTYFIVLQSFYIHTNLISAVYLFLFCGLFWLGRAQDRDELVILGMGCLVPFTLCRTEAPLFALIFLVPILADAKLSRRLKRVCLGCYSCFVLVWYAKLFMMIGAGSDILTRGKIAMLLLPLLGYTTVMLLPGKRRVEMIRGWLPELMLALLSFGLLVVVLLRRDHMATSFYSFTHNLVAHGLWGVAWIALIALLVLAVHTARIPHNRIFAIALPCFVLMLLCLAAARIPYRIGWGDSANRILTHLFPIVVFYLTMRFGNGVRCSETPGGSDQTGRRF
ncbi:MAG: hypothetical protein O2923_13150 [Verrucomicrobia bacterium]|nr:hypothetical protein [Verrucomicrobiota bacterium]MDA1087990.1 hypothetical protein [Verrucomicrobiota bacterium]